MMYHPRVRRLFDTFATAASEVAGRPSAFATAVAVLVLWATTGPLLGFSDTWQLIINTGTTIITFLMVFLVQHTQNKDSLALHTKLDALIRAVDGADDKLERLEENDEAEIKRMRDADGPR